MSARSQHEAQQADARLRKYSRPYGVQYPRKPHLWKEGGEWCYRRTGPRYLPATLWEKWALYKAFAFCARMNGGAHNGRT